MSDPTNPRFLSQPDPEPMTQLRAALALVALMQEDGPALYWSVEHTPVRLNGMLHADTDTDKRAGLSAWQRVIGAGPVTAVPNGPREHLEVNGSYEGVPVRVVTIVTAACPTCGTNEAHMNGEVAA